MCERDKKMSSINAIGSQINSQVNFTGSKKSSKKADGTKKQDLSKLGGRTFEEKYSKDGKPVNMTTANAGILLGDYILDHLIEFTVAGVTFVALALKGKKILSGVTGSFVDAGKQITQKETDKIGAFQKIKNYANKVKLNIKNLKNTNADNITNNMQEVVQENASKTVMKGSFIDKLADKADNPDSLFAKFVKKVSKNPEAGSDDVRNFFAKKLGITRGADIVDNATAIGIAGGGAKIAKDGADIGTDLNDEDVTDKAAAANHRNLEKAKKAANVVLKAL